MKAYCFLTLLLLASGAFALEAPPKEAEVFPLDKVVSGLAGTGFTVLKGEAIVPFKVEVEGIVQQDEARGPIIVCQLSGEGLETSGVLEAMSGSPVYVDGKLLGAVAYAWPFSKKSLCGVTPAERLVPLLKGGIGTAAAGTASSSGGRTLALFWDDVKSGAAMPPIGANETSGSLGGLAEAGFQWALAKPRETGMTAGEAQPPPGPGSLIGVQLVSGDVEFTAYGTVAYSQDGGFVAFGHPFLRLGAVDLPVVRASVAAIVPSMNKGMKLCSSGPPAGEVFLDASSGVAGRWGKTADTLPVEVSFEGTQSPPKTFLFGLARQRFLTPALLEAALGVIQNSMEGAADPKTVTARMSASMVDGREVALNPLSFSGPLPFTAMNDFAGNVLELLLYNRYEPLPVKKVKLVVKATPGLSGGTPKTAWLEPPVARRGEPALLRVAFQPVQGRQETFQSSLKTGGWPQGGVELWVGDVFTLWRKLMGTEEAVPANGEEILRYLNSIPENDRLYVAVVAPSNGKLLQDRRLDEAPPSLSPLLGGGGPKTESDPPPYRLIEIQPGPKTGPADGILDVPVQVEEVNR